MTGSVADITGYTTLTTNFSEDIFLLSKENSNKYYQITNVSLVDGFNKYYTTAITQSAQSFSDPIINLQTGFNGSLWAITSTADSNIIYRGNHDSNALTLTTALQIFYPCMKMRFKKRFNFVNTITDTYSQKGDILQYPEYTHPQLFFYKNWTSFSNDCYKRFGQETASNLAYEDLSGSGYQFNSYLYNISLDKSSNFDDDDKDSYYYLVLRGYSPTEQFGCMTRFFLPQRYDFGYMPLGSITDVIGRIEGEEALTFNPSFSNSLNIFNQAFSVEKIYGSNVITGFNGSTIITTGFSNFLYQYSTFYSAYQASANLIESVASNVASNLSNYTNRYLSRILPVTSLQRQNIQSPLSYTLMFKSGIPTMPLSNSSDKWGLGWNLGFAKQDYTGYTFYRAPSFYKILDDYIYLKMNTEYNLNHLDTTSQENLAITRDPQGNANLYAAKLLLTPFGTYTTSLVQNGSIFKPTVEKIDMLKFEWFGANGDQISNFDCEFDISMQITENIGVITPVTAAAAATATATANAKK